MENDLLLPEAIGPLVRNTIFAGHIHHFMQADSTNLLASRAAARAGDGIGHEPASEGEVFLAEEQTAGRGRGDHSWHSERGTGIYCSVVLRPNIVPADALWLSLIAAVAVQDAIREVTSLHADIRWPNDLVFDDRKCCGILTELSSESIRVNHVVVGIGVNVNQRGFPGDLRDSATSLMVETGKEWSRVEIAAALLKSLDREYRGLLRAIGSPYHSPELRFAPLLQRVENRSSYARGKHVYVEEDGGYSGVTDGLDARGFLRVKTEQGLRMVISGGVRPVPRRPNAAGR